MPSGAGDGLIAVSSYFQTDFRDAEMFSVQRYDGTTSEAGRQQQQQGTVALAGEIAAAGVRHSLEHRGSGCGGAFRPRRGAAGLAQGRANTGVSARQRQASMAVVVVDGGPAPGESGAAGLTGG